MTDLTREGLVELADRLMEAAYENAASAIDSDNWPYSVEAMAFAANATAVAISLRARAMEAGRATTGATDER